MKKLNLIFSKIILVIAGLLCFFGCKKEAPIECPISSFIEEFPKRKINLVHVLGEQIALKSGDTTYYSISFNKKTRVNTIKNTKTGELVFEGYVSRFRGLFFLSEKKSDSAWHIQSIKIKGDLMYGFNSMSSQMCALDLGLFPTYFRRESLKIPNIIADTGAYKPIKKAMKIIYEEILASMEPDTLIEIGAKSKENDRYDTNELITESEPLDDNIVKLYPNPVVETLTLENLTPSKLSCEIIDLQGVSILKTELNQGKNELLLSNLRSGIYFVNVIDINQNSMVVKIRKE